MQKAAIWRKMDKTLYQVLTASEGSWRHIRNLLTQMSDWRYLPESPLVSALHVCRHNWNDAFLQHFLWTSSLWMSDDKLQHPWFGTDSSVWSLVHVVHLFLVFLWILWLHSAGVMSDWWKFFSRNTWVNFAFCSKTLVFVLYRLQLFSFVFALVHMSMYYFLSWIHHVWTYQPNRGWRCVAVDTGSFNTVKIRQQHSGAPVVMNDSLQESKYP